MIAGVFIFVYANDLASKQAFITLVLVAQDVPLANYLRTIEKERLLANLQGQDTASAIALVVTVMPDW